MSCGQKTGGLFRGGKVKQEGCLVLSFAGPEPDVELLKWVRAGDVAGVVLFSDNFVSVSQMTEAITVLREAGDLPLRMMIDEEGGRVRRLPESVSPMPAISTYGESKNAAAAAADYAMVCRTLAKMGIDTLLAPVADVRTKHNQWLADRTYSDNPHRVADFTTQVVRAIGQTPLASCAKHFPGLGGVSDDLHHKQFIVKDSVQQIEERDLVPFHAAVNAGVEMIMVSHAIYQTLDPTRPAVFSPLIIDRLLRKQLGFSGIVLSDDLAMAAISGSIPIEKAIEQALLAGCDLLLICRNRPLQRRAVQFLSREGNVR